MTLLIERLRAEADLCRNETADDIANLLNEAADKIERLQTEVDGLQRFALTGALPEDKP